MARLTALLAFAALLAVPAALAQKDLKSFDLLTKYILDNGGKVRAKLGVNKDGIRGLFASENIKAGEFIVSIPTGTIMNVGGITGSFLTPTLSVLRELRHPASRHKPYLDTFPKRDEVTNACNIDKQYWPLFESDYWTKFTSSWQGFLERALNGSANAEMEITIPEALGDVEGKLTLDELKYACAISATRYVASGRRNRLLMIPIYDMANHVRDCNNTLSGTDDQSELVSLVAGKDLKAGDEICYGYGTTNFLADYSLTHYGFVLKENPPRLLVIDHHQFNPEANHQHFTEEQFVATSPDQVKAEIQRLKGIQTELQRLDKEAAKTKSRPKKGTSYVADMLLDLQAYRRQAVDYEIKRLEKIKF